MGAGNGQLPPPRELLTILLQAAIPVVAACWAHPMPFCRVSCRAWCGRGVLQCSAPCLPASWAVAAVVGEFLAGLSEVFVWAVVQGVYYFSLWFKEYITFFFLPFP